MNKPTPYPIRPNTYNMGITILTSLLRLTVLTFFLPLAVRAQSHAGGDGHEGEAPLIKTSRVTITNPAEFQKAATC